MADPIHLKISTNAEEVLRRLEVFPEKMGGEIAHALDNENQNTVGHIQVTRMSRRGPTTLGVRTNRLRSSVRPSLAVVNGNEINSAIGTNVVYAGVHEYGFDGIVQVRTFQRRRLSTAQSTAEFNPKTGKITKRKKKRSVTAIVTVRAHARHMKMPARAPIHTGISERRANYNSAISAAILTAWNNPGATT